MFNRFISIHFLFVIGFSLQGLFAAQDVLEFKPPQIQERRGFHLEVRRDKYVVIVPSSCSNPFTYRQIIEENDSIRCIDHVYMTQGECEKWCLLYEKLKLDTERIMRDFCVLDFDAPDFKYPNCLRKCLQAVVTAHNNKSVITDAIKAYLTALSFYINEVLNNRKVVVFERMDCPIM